MILLVALQIAASVPTRPPATKDSAKLVARVRDAEFLYLMDWRHEWELWMTDVFLTIQANFKDLVKVPRPAVRHPIGVCPLIFRPPHQTPVVAQPPRMDVDQHQAMAHMIPAPLRSQDLWLCPMWVSPVNPEPPDEALGIDNAFPRDYRDTVRARRAPLLALLDSAAHALPGDAWLAGQRVRIHVDQQETVAALRASAECRAAKWWCVALRGYVLYTAHDAVGAAAAFDTAIKRMPLATRCQWGDLSALLTYSARTAYQQLSCAQQDSVDARIWWLADPLYLVPTNDRRTEHYARRVLGELHAGNDVDEREDMRPGYTGPAVEELLVRYGWPTTMGWTPPPQCGRLGCTYTTPPGWSRFDTRDTYLGLTNPWGFYTTLTGTVIPSEVPHQAQPLYWGPQYHTVPTWSAINDPVHAKASDWDLGPARQDTLVWDSSWWATEFYRRYEGPLVDLVTQIAFVRRATTAAIVAAMQWNVDSAILAPPAHAAVGVITSGGPNEKPHIVGLKMDGAHPRAILTPVESRPLLLGVEMVPENDSGPAGRTRFGIAPPAPLGALKAGQLAISDPILARADSSELAPTSIQETLPRMFGSTRLQNPSRVAVFWEVYGQHDGDTVDVALRIVRQGSTGFLNRAGGLLGIGSAGNDSIIVKWQEPRPGDPLAVTEGGIAIRPRGVVLNLSGLAAGDYALDVQVARHGTAVLSTAREFTVVRH